MLDAGGGLLRVVRLFFRPGGAREGARGSTKTPAEVGGAHHIGIVGCFSKVLSSRFTAP
jgi:hypothetical protein